MKNFLKKIWIFFLPLLVIVSVGEAVIRKPDNDYKKKFRDFQEVSSSVGTLILGSSHAVNGVNPKLLSDDAFNMAYVSQSLDIDFKILRYALRKGAPIDTVFLSISYFSMHGNLHTSAGSWRLKNYNIYTPIRGDWKPKHQLEMLVRPLADNLKLIKGITKGKHDALSIDSFGFRPSSEVATEEQMIKSAEHALGNHTKENDDLLDEMTNTLSAIIELCEANDIELILFTTPVYPSYAERMDSLQYQQNQRAIAQALEGHANIRYYNFLKSKQFDRTDFRNADHLNTVGAARFTPILKRAASTTRQQID